MPQTQFIAIRFAALCDGRRERSSWATPKDSHQHRPEGPAFNSHACERWLQRLTDREAQKGRHSI
jgi:hypothetical protein